MFENNPVTHQPRRILVIEDDSDSATMLQTFLAINGHEASVSSDAETGLETAAQIRPDVIICDIALPGAIDGLGMARSLRAKPDNDSLLLIALSGYGEPEDRQRSVAAGFDIHLTKPTDLDALLTVIDKGPGSN